MPAPKTAIRGPVAVFESIDAWAAFIAKQASVFETFVENFVGNSVE